MMEVNPKHQLQDLGEDFFFLFLSFHSSGSCCTLKVCSGAAGTTELQQGSRG